MVEETIRDLDPSSREAIRHIITNINDSLILDDRRFKELLEK